MAENGFWVRPEDIPLDLNLLRYADGDPVGEQLRVYTLTGLNTNFARPCFALAGRGDADLDDVAGVLEETLHRILDAGGTPEEPETEPVSLGSETKSMRKVSEHLNERNVSDAIRSKSTER